MVSCSLIYSDEFAQDSHLISLFTAPFLATWHLQSASCEAEINITYFPIKSNKKICDITVEKYLRPPYNGSYDVCKKTKE